MKLQRWKKSILIGGASLLMFSPLLDENVRDYTTEAGLRAYTKIVLEIQGNNDLEFKYPSEILENNGSYKEIPSRYEYLSRIRVIDILDYGLNKNDPVMTLNMLLMKKLYFMRNRQPDEIKHIMNLFEDRIREYERKWARGKTTSISLSEYGRKHVDSLRLAPNIDMDTLPGAFLVYFKDLISEVVLTNTLSEIMYDRYVPRRGVRILDEVLKKFGVEFIEIIPAVYDPWESLGGNQQTKHSVCSEGHSCSKEGYSSRTYKVLVLRGWVERLDLEPHTPIDLHGRSYYMMNSMIPISAILELEDHLADDEKLYLIESISTQDPAIQRDLFYFLTLYNHKSDLAVQQFTEFVRRITHGYAVPGRFLYYLRENLGEYYYLKRIIEIHEILN